MPRKANTRKQRAKNLLRLLETGPVYTPHVGPNPFTVDEATERYKTWVNSWILPEVKDLIPELRNELRKMT
jgi:hypothetical protein